MTISGDSDANGCVEGVCLLRPRSKQPLRTKTKEPLPRLKIGDGFPSNVQIIPLAPKSEDADGASEVNINNNKMMTFNQLQGNAKAVVLDFWSTTCIRCPASMSKLETLAAASAAASKGGATASGIDAAKEVVYASINLDDQVGAIKMVKEGGWTHVAHYYIDEENKAMIKGQLGMTSVPFIVTLDENGRITQVGSMKQVNIDHLVAVTSQAAVEAGAAPSPSSSAFDLNADF